MKFVSKQTRTLPKLALLVTLISGCFSFSARVQAQDFPLDDLLNQGGLPGLSEDPSFEIQLQANSLEVGAAAVLSVRVELPIGRYTYSMNDENSATKIRIDEISGLEAVSDFIPDREPKIVVDKELGWTLEKYFDNVTWVRHYRVTDPEKAKLTGSINGSFCNATGCLPFNDKFALDVTETEATLPKPPETGRPYTTELTPMRRSGKADPVSLKFSLTPEDAKAGEEVTVSIRMQLDEGWHTFPQDFEGVGTATKIKASVLGLDPVGDGFEANHEPELIEVDLGDDKPVKQFLFEGEVIWSRKYKVADGIEPGQYGVDGAITYQICKESCLRPFPVEFGLGLPVGESETSEEPDTQLAETAPGIEKVDVDTPEQIAEMAALYNAEQSINFEKLGTAGKVKTTFLTAIFGAFVGGIILNLMPCVFPVLGIKVMGFVQLAGDDEKKIRLHGLAFTMGLVVSMWCLAGVILFLKLAVGESVNWGQQMGNPYFVGGIICLLFILGLNMAGVFEMGTTMTRVGGGLQKKKGYSQSFFSGILTTLIATPCSGPFLGAAMGYTLAQSAPVAIFLFTVFALGIALPYLLLSFFPAAIKKLPRPGPWMETFKVTMAFALFATSAFFLKTYGGQTGTDGMAWLTMALVVIALAFYFYGRWSLPHLSKKVRLLKGTVLPLAVVGIGGWMAYHSAQFTAPPTPLEGWQSWRPGKVEYLTRKKNRVVFVDYTADW